MIVMFFISICMIGAVTLAGNCMDGYEEEDAHTYVNSGGILVTHCPYDVANAICCTPGGGGGPQQ